MYWVFKGILKPILIGLYSIKPEGRENVPKKGPAIIAANHLSFLDSFFIPLVVQKRKVTYLAKADYFKNWKTAWFFNMVGQIPTEREGGKKSEHALSAALDVLKQGKLLGIYPEGTRSPDGRLYRGRTGVARLALQAGVPVIPTGLIGTSEVMPIDHKIPKLTGRLPVRVRFGKPLDFSSYAGRERDRFALRSITDEIQYEIMQLSGQEYVDEYASRKPSVPLPES
ncbi:MAG: 1-acyl-sn-glycerol-3-phosphate acyltransferase, partial [Actinobacteria bacterium]|nr:1-acyl-sn-glycerol-3-phosphate acyltransferase [Actinomycetota bacterium]